MSNESTPNTTIIPCLRYRDAPAAIEWLCRTFGFERHLLVENEDGSIAHAQLTFGKGMVMLGTVAHSGTEYGDLIVPPDEIGGRQTQSTYIVVGDPDALYAQVQQAGVRIVMEIRDEDDGGRGFSCFDLEGHLWSFGSYDPWAAS